MRTKPKRAHLIRLIGKEVLKTLPVYRIENDHNEVVPATAARRYIREQKLDVNIVIETERPTGTVDRFYWCKKGLFSADFAECNYVNFIELREIALELGDHGNLYKRLEKDFFLELEDFNHEYKYC